MKIRTMLIAFAGLLVFQAIIPLQLSAQEPFKRDTIILAAREIINETQLLE